MSRTAPIGLCWRSQHIAFSWVDAGRLVAKNAVLEDLIEFRQQSPIGPARLLGVLAKAALSWDKRHLSGHPAYRASPPVHVLDKAAPLGPVRVLDKAAPLGLVRRKKIQSSTHRAMTSSEIMTVLIWFHTSQYRDFKAWRILKKSVGTGKREKERLMEYNTEDDLQLIETMTAGRPK